MGQHNSNFELASEARRAAERFDQCEIKLIKETFKDLCHLNGGSMRIDKELFLQYLPLPGLLGERLFAVFDKKCSGQIDYEEFVCGLAVTCRGSWDEKVEFIFNIYDMHGQGAVNREELAALLNHVPKSIMRFGRAVTLDTSTSDHHHHHHHHNKHMNNHSHSNNHHHHTHHPPPHHHPPPPEHRRLAVPTQQHPPPSSTGTASARSDRCSPERPSTPAAPPPPAAAAVAVPAGVAATPSGTAAKAGSAGGGAGAGGAVGVGGVPSPEGGGATVERGVAMAMAERRVVESVEAVEVGEVPGGVGGVGGRMREEGSTPLTSGNLMQLHLASLSPTGEGGAGGVSANGVDSGSGCNGSLTGGVTGGGAVGGGVVGAISPHGKAGPAGEEATATAVAAEAGGVVGHQPGALSPASALSGSSIRAAASAGGNAETLVEGADGVGVGGGSGGGVGGGSGAESLATVSLRSEAGGAAEPRLAEPVLAEPVLTEPVGTEHVATASVDFSSGAGEGGGATLTMSGEELGAHGEQAATPPGAAVVGGGRAAGGGGGSTPSVTAGGSTHVGLGERGRRGTLRSDASTDDGTTTSAATHPHYAHWEDFTNNDIVDQAFQDCDLNHNGKLSFSEFRLWIERNPMVTQFLQSVFPYDEHREWGGDRKHLPFIHNREFTGSPMLSDGSHGVDSDSSDDETRRLLLKARNTTRNPMLREGIDRLIEEAALGGDQGGAGGDALAGSVRSASNGGAALLEVSQNGEMHSGNSRRSNRGNMVGGLGFMGELSPRSAKAMQHQTVAKQGFLWKQGYRLRTWKQRWYVLVGNCIYYYQHEADVYPCGVMFLTGSFVEPLQEGANERKGYWGIEISRNNEQNHRRRWYTRSKVEQVKWLKELRKASAVVPVEDDFEIGEELGQGRFSRVCMCVNKHTLERKAVKIIMKEDMKAEEKDLLRAEIAIMKLVNHPNIIRMEAVYESKRDIFIVMELHSGGELFDRIVGRPRFTEDEAFTVIQPLVESVAYLHEMGIVHRDLKPENILCGSRIEDIKIADFGLSKMVLPDEIMKMPCGTLTYVAPEVLTLNGYGKEADIWSVGTIMYLLLRGRLPFDGDTREEIIENTIHGAIAWQNDPVWAGFTEDGKDLVLGMLNKDVTRRYTAKDVLRHPWVTRREQRREEHPEDFDF